MARYFSDLEVKGLDSFLVQKLDLARGLAGIPFVITSGKRDGGGSSSHHAGLAVDLRCNTSRERFLILEALLSVGFDRIGVYDKHVHVDVDTSKDPFVVWWGVSS